MFKHILVPVDLADTDLAKSAIETAVSLARADASVTPSAPDAASIPASIQSGNSPASPSAAITARTTPTPPSTRVGSEWPDSPHGTAAMLRRHASALTTGVKATTKPKAVAPQKISLSAITVMSLVHSPYEGSAKGDKGQICRIFVPSGSYDKHKCALRRKDPRIPTMNARLRYS